MGKIFLFIVLVVVFGLGIYVSAVTKIDETLAARIEKAADQND